MIGLFLITVGLSAGLTLLVRHGGIRAGLLDVPDAGRKQHAVAVPALGGIAVFAAFGTAFAFKYAFDLEFARSLSGSVTTLLVTASAVLMLGIFDDIWPVRAKTKLAVQIVAAVGYVVIARPIDALHFGGGLEVTSEILIGIFCVFWLVSCCNAVNLLDGMDGMAALQGMLGFGTLAVIASLHGDVVTATVCMLLGASVCGFAIFNAPPASIFLGDAGSMTIGYLLGALTLSACHMVDGRYGLAIPMAVMIIPAFDTTMAIVRRAQKGKGIMAPDREHFHHRLSDAGRSVWNVLGVFAVMYGLCAAAAIASVWTSSGLIASLACGVVLVTCVGTRTFGHLELRSLGERLVAKVSLISAGDSPANDIENADSASSELVITNVITDDSERTIIPISASISDDDTASVGQRTDEDDDLRRAA
jgi:UDP-GlcNAc:undecaprenyl-phosphate/decaprenyl-phosphate GlcNAc-1-phosphate transferase